MELRSANGCPQRGALLFVLLLLVDAITCSAQDPSYFGRGEESGAYGGATGSGGFAYRSKYERSMEVQQECKPYLRDLSPDPSFRTDLESSRWRIMNELTFLNGQWREESGEHPLMPFMRALFNSSGSLVGNKAAKLVSHWITDVDLFKRASPVGNTINVSAVMQIGISSERSLSYMGSGFQGFQVYPGFSLLSIVMEGVYGELRGGDRLLCLLGTTRLPSRGKNSSLPWDWLDLAWNKGSFTPPTSDDDKILAVLHFPKELHLVSRAVVGRLQSLHERSAANYFDPVDLSSQLGAYSNYEFVSGELVNSVCKNQVASMNNVYQGSSFCTVFQEVLTAKWLDILPNWNCTVSNVTCTKLGPFSDSTSDFQQDGGFNGTQLLVQDIRCVDYAENDGSQSANISAVLRAVLAFENKNLAFERTSLDELTLAVEGKWNSIFGGACMVGCRGGKIRPSLLTPLKSVDQSCDTRVYMQIPLTLSLKQRSILQGSVSSMESGNASMYPLSFHLPLYPVQLPPDLAQNMTYEYTKINAAGALLERDEPVGFGESIKSALLEYPCAAENGDFSVLFDDLSLQSLAITNPESAKGLHLKHFIDLDVIAIEDHMKLHWVQVANYSMAPASVIDNEVEKVAEQKKYYKIASQIKIRDNLGNKVTAVSAEGEYDPTVGHAYLVGCQDVNAPWNIFHENAELLEEGLDCMMQVRIKYPPTNARWFINPTVMLTITSIRTEDDPLFFSTIELETFPFLYKRQREEIVSRKSLEGGLNILTMSLILGCIVTQLMYMRTHSDSMPYISLLMLAVQAVGFSIPLITGMEAFFARITSDSDDMRDTVLNEGRWSHVIGYIVNVFTLATFLLTLRIAQKVYKSRLRMLSRRPLETWRVPNEKRVLAICAAIHALGFISVLIIHSVRLSQRPVSSSTYMDWYGGLHKQYDWELILKEYYGLVQDLFLLPQVVGNHLWVVKGKPLRMLFYIGVTVLRLLPHIYDSLRSPVFNPYFADEFEYANPSWDFYSKAGDIAIPVLAVMLAIVIYIQQRWNGLKWGKVLKQGSSKLLRMGSRMYERLPSQTYEAEMVESGNAREEEEESAHINGSKDIS